jgi:hypothetical protein
MSQLALFPRNKSLLRLRLQQNIRHSNCDSPRKGSFAPSFISQPAKKNTVFRLADSYVLF